MVSDPAVDLKSLVNKLSNTLETDLIEPLSVLCDFSAELKSLSQEPSATMHQFIQNLPSITSVLLSKSKFNEEGLLKVAELISNLFLSLPSCLSFPKYLESLRNLVEIDKNLYQNYMQDLRIGSWNPESALKPLEETWRNSLGIGSLVDAVKCDGQYDRRCWSSGKVVEIDAEGYLKISFEEEGSEWDRNIHRSSHELSEYHSKVQGESWRDSLGKGSFVDCFDNSNVWYNSTVIDKRIVENNNNSFTTELLIGFRVYETYGDKSDEKGNYRGWSSKYDEWISKKSPRLSPFGFNGRLWPIPQVTFNEEKIIDDSNDVLEDFPNTFCVTRSKKCSSVILIKALNTFGKNNLFEFLLNVLNDSQKWPGFEVIFTFVYIVGKVYCLFHKRFAMNYVLKFKDAVFSCLINASTNNYREFSKEKLDTMFELLELLLKRVLTIQQKNLIVDQFLLKFSLKNLETPFLERRIHGVKGVIEAINKSRASKFRGYQSYELAKWVQSNNLISEIFGPNGHFQLVARTPEILKLLASENQLTNENLNEIWAASQRNNEDMRKSVYQMLTDVVSTLKSESLDYIVAKITELPPIKIQKEEIELIYQLTRYTVRAGCASIRASDFFHHTILFTGDEFTENIKTLCLESYCNLLKSWEKSKSRPSVMAQCVERIRENKATLHAIKIIEKLLATFSVTYSSKELPTRNAIVQELINEQGALTAIFDNLKSFKENSNPESVNKQSYLDEINARLGFLKSLITECHTIRLSERQLNLLWDLLYESALHPSEKHTFLKWLSETTENQLSGKKIFEDSDITRFFNQKICSADKDYAEITLEEFSVFKNCFLIANLFTSKMKRLFSNLSMTTSEMASEFDYEISVAPVDLLGMQCLRKILNDTVSEKIANSASDLLYDVYNHISSVNVKKIREELLHYLLNIIETGSIHSKKRALESLKRFIEECEKDGTGNLKPHSSLLKGDLHTITVVNNITYHPYSPDIPKKFELKVYSNSTLWELRCLIGKKVKCMYDQFKIFRSFPNYEIKERENGKTINNLKFRSNETLSISRKNVNKPKAALLTAQNKLTPRAEKIFTSWFNKYADKGDKMSQEGCAAFNNSCTGDPCKAGDRKMQDFFLNHDSDHDGLLTLEDFLKFYEDSCVVKPSTVWNNLASHHYRQDLKRFDDEDPNENLDLDLLPTTILISNHRNFDLLFTILSETALANEAWDLVTKLPTNPEILKIIHESDENSNWEVIFSTKSWHHLAYILQIVESFIEDPAEENKEKFEEGRKWKINFIKSQGLAQLLLILNELEGELDRFQKVCLASVLKIVVVFILAAFSAFNPEISEALDNVRKESEEIDLFEESLEENKKETEKKPEEIDTKIHNSLTFKALVTDLLELKLAENLIRTLDFSRLINSLLRLMSEALRKKEYDVENNHILDSALELWMSCILHKHDLLSVAYNFSVPFSFPTFIIASLTQPKTFMIRRSFSQAYLSICTKVKHSKPVGYFLNVLFKYIHKNSISHECVQLFELATSLITLDKAQISQDYFKLSSYLIERIENHPQSEKKTSNGADRVLVGLLKLCDKVFEVFPELRVKVVDLARFEKIFKDFLFPDPHSFENLDYDLEYFQNTLQLLPPKAKFRETRVAVYGFLMRISAENPLFLSRLEDFFRDLKKRVKTIKNWGYSPTAEMRSMHGYSGIINLGSICYMISMLQQFYMIPQFRYSILAVNDGIPPTNSIKPAEPDLDDNVLHQLQNMFGFLEVTDRHAYNPFAFCYSFKDFNGNPTNTSIQQDSQEFLNMIFDKLDRSLSNTPYNSLLQDIFGGKICNQFICNECNSIKESVEDFYNLSLDVKHSKSIFESFQKLLAGDTISDFYCETCTKKVDIVKRAVISKLPNIMILHLQRIVFNFDTFSNEKINSRLEFPLNLNAHQYTKSAVSGEEGGEEFEFDLVGVVVHTGTADIGHYYSYIRDNYSGSYPIPSQLSSKKWLEFNDSSVRSFNPDNIEAECFGGFDSEESLKYSSKDTSKNAYMLIYEKKIKGPLKINVLEGDSTALSRTTLRNFSEIHRTMPSHIYQSVLLDNQIYSFEKHIYSVDFFEFFTEVMKHCKNFEDISHIAIEYFLDLIAHAYHNKSMPSLVTIINECFEKYPNSEEMFLKRLVQDNLEILTNHLLICSDKVSRESFAGLLAVALVASAKKSFGEGSLARLIIDALVSLIPNELTKHAIRFEQYWQLFSKLTEEVAFSEYLLQKGVVSLFIDFYLSGNSPLLKPDQQRQPIGNKLWIPAFGNLIVSMSNLHKHSNTFDFQSILSEDDKKCLFDKEFYEKSLKNSYETKSLSQIICYWAVNNKEFSMTVADVLLRGINEIDLDDSSLYYETIGKFLEVQDDFQISVHENSKNVYGSQAIKSIDDEVTSYPSTLYFDPNDNKNSVLGMIWNQRKRWDHSCLALIKYLLELCEKNSLLLEYVLKLPPPTYQFSSVFHWIEDYIQNSKLITFPSAKKESLFTQNKEILEKIKQSNNLDQNQHYIVGDITDENMINLLENDNVMVSVIQFRVKFGKSLPTGKLNSALPDLKLYLDKTNESSLKKHSDTQTIELKSNDIQEPEKNKKINYTIDLNSQEVNDNKNELTSEDSSNKKNCLLENEADCIIRFEVSNNKSEAVRVELEFESGLQNYYCPYSAISVQVGPMTTRQIISIVKIQPEDEWGKIEYDWKVLRPKQNEVKESNDAYTESLEFFGIEDIGMNVSDFDDEITAPTGKISCPRCTLFNDASDIKCSVCGFVFAKR